MACSTSSKRPRSLPLDLWYMVVDHLQQQAKRPPEDYSNRYDWKREVLKERTPYLRDQISLSSTSSWFRNLLAPRLFAFVILQNTTKSALSIEAIARGKWSSYVKELRYIAIGETGDPLEKVYPAEVARVLSSLSWFPGLQSITVEFPFDYEEIYDDLFQNEFDADPENALVAEKEDSWRGLMVASFRDIISNYASSSADQLPRSLTIHDLNLATVSIFTTQPFRDFLSTLKAFNLSIKAWDNGVGWNLNTQEIFYGFPEQLGPWFFNHLSSVEEFTFDARESSRLGVGYGDFRAHDISLRDARMPHLRKITLKHIIICPELQEFLLRIIATLETIVLKNCFAMISRYDSTSTSWHTFFTALARKNPPCLTSFELICENTKDKMLDLDFTYNDPRFDPPPDTLARARNKRQTQPTALIFPYGYLDDKYGFGYRSHIDNQIAFVAGDDEKAYQELVGIMNRNAQDSARTALSRIQYPGPGEDSD